MRVRVTFRSTFLASLLSLVGLTAFLIGVTSYMSARFTAHDLSEQLLEQTSARVEEQVQKLVRKAVDVSALNARLVHAGQLRADHFPGLIRYWLEVMAVDRELSSVFIGAEATGESTGVSRLQGKLSIWQSNRNATGGLDQRDFWPEGYPTSPYAFDPAKPAPDIRTRPWYSAARAAGHSIWTETYAFLGVSGASDDVQGVTYAAPVHDRTGALVGVLSADFDLKGLCAFLRTLKVARTGYAFVVERRKDGSPRLIAHPDPAFLDAASAGATGRIRDGRVRSIVTGAPAAGGFTPIHFAEGGVSYIGGTRSLSGDDVPPWRIGVVVPEADVMERVDRSNRVSALIAAGGLLLAIVFGIIAARQVARPLENLSREMSAIADLRLEPRPIAHSVVIEVDRVAVAAEEIKTGLRQKRVLEKYVPRGARADVEKNLAGNVALGGTRVRRAILFSDLRGFTSMSERLAPDVVVALLNRYLEAMTGVILENGGDINEYIGDAILAVFVESAAAVAAAVEMQEALARLSGASDDEDLRALRMGIGIHVGEIVEGNIGTLERVKFGVVGDTVNLAARIQDRSRDGKHTCVLVSDAVRVEAEGSFELELVGDLAMKGKAQPVRVFEVVGRRR